jgi:pyruvate dehydrogenase E2 component (dihydrolipoamide acetyltransferase)
MAFEIVMPRLGWNMETGSLGEWLKKDGEYVEAGQPLYTVESDKATQEVEALDSGVLRIPPDAPRPGQEVSVGTVLGYLLAEGETAPSGGSTPIQPGAGQTAVGDGATRNAASGPATPRADGVTRVGRPPASSPRARRVARELGVDWKLLNGSGRTGRIVERDVRAAASGVGTAQGRVSPLARRMAAELGVDIEQLAAHMPGKRIERADVEAAAAAVAAAAPAVTLAAPTVTPPMAIPAAASAAASPLPGGVTLPISAMRRTIAERMAASAHTVAPVTLTTEADATELVRIRKQLKDAGQSPLPSYNDFLARLAAVALQEYPMLNARFEGDGIVQAATINLGIAVDTERGLLAPVVRDAQTKTVRQIAAETSRLIEATRAGRISAAELRGGTFTITNLGMYEIDAFTPIINLPECAILGVGRIVAKQVVVDAEAGQVAIRQMVFLSLTFDHRLVDGAPAARFLQQIKQYVEKPYLWLVS